MSRFTDEFLDFSSNFVTRAILSVLMLSTFLKLCGKNKVWLVLISFFLTLGISFELITITQPPNTPLTIHPAFIRIVYFSILLLNTIPAFSTLYPKIRLFNDISTIRSFLFLSYSIGLMLCILSFRAGQVQAQLLLLAIIHMVSFVSSVSCALSLKNIHPGKFFYVYPALLVIINDIFAYLIGKAIGKTPLIVVSPNKTLEGFIGGFIFTLMAGVLLSFLKIHGLFLPDKLDNRLSEPLDSPRWYLRIPRIYLHNLAFVFFASFFAPLCGFVASAIKRTFDKKDFGNIIPGHGGITDRFDCQILMVFFTYYYMNGIMRPKKISVEAAYSFLKNNLKDEEIRTLSKILIKDGY